MTPDTGSGDAGIAFLVPVSDSQTLDATVEYAAREAREVAAETDSRVVLYLTTSVGDRSIPGVPESVDADALLSHAAEVAEGAFDLADPDGSVAVETARIEQVSYPFDPFEYADSLLEFAEDHGVNTVIVDPGHRMASRSPIGGSYEDELRAADAVDVEVAPVERPAREGRLVTRGGLAQFLTVFGLSFGFYMVLGGFAEPYFDLVTGAATALLVAGVLSRITFEQTPRPTRMLATVGRWTLYAPYLFWKIAVANVQIAYVVLHPSLPIDPSFEEFDAAVWGGMPVATLANSITLTPGTLTVDVRNREFVIHSLTRDSREDLLDGTLERAVRFVFYGRSAMRHPSPRERIDVEEGESS